MINGSQRSVSALIEVLGASTVAHLLGLPGSTVRDWKRRSVIPVTYWPRIIRECRRRGPVLGWVNAESLMHLHAER